MTTGMERLQAALNGEKADRIPIFCNIFDQGASELGLSKEEYFGNGELVAQAQLQMRKNFGYDNVWSMFYVAREAELLGCKKIRFFEDGPPNVKHFVIKDYADIEKLEIPADLESHPAFVEPLKCLGILKREVGGKYPICAYITATMCLPSLLMGMEQWFDLLFTGPAEVKDLLLHKCHEFFVKELNAYRNNGANVIVYSNPFASTDFVPMNFFHKSSLPWVKKDIDAVGLDGLVFYCGMSRMNPVIETLIDQVGFPVFYPSPRDNLKESCEIIKNRALTCGVIDDLAMVAWNCDLIK
ncbi:MAG: uroporphyrinogen decarboxylase family protein, partial [Candidatus Rifleibacteriota bacterium]